MAWFAFTDDSAEVFVLKVKNADQIAHARGLIAGTVTADPLVGGTVVKSSTGYNIGWSFHLDPASLFFFESSTEVGDSTMRYIEDHLAEVGGALLPGSVWTGWSTVFLEELNHKIGGVDPDTIRGSVGSDILFGRAGDDRLVAGQDDDHLAGGLGRDAAFGGNGNDKLSGGRGDDTLSGGEGDDVLVGEKGCDRLRGGEGRDTFLLTPASGHDVILDFTDTDGPEDDVIDLRPYEFSNKAEIGKISAGDDLVLDLGGGNRLTIVDYLQTHTANQINNDILI